MMVSREVQHARLLRPFSTSRLDQALWFVETNAASIHHRKLKLLLEPPADQALWVFELSQLQNDLQTLAEQCEEAWRKLELLAESAPGDYGRAVDAMRAVMAGMREAPPSEASEPLAA